MAFPRRSSRSPRSRYTLGLLLLTAVTLLVLDLPGTGPLQPVRNVVAQAFRPFRSAGDAVFAPVGNGWKGAFGYRKVKDDNNRLRARLDEAQGNQAELERLRIQVEELQKLNGVTAGSVQTRTAEVVSEPVSSFDSLVEIDQGGGGGVKKGMAIITGLSTGPGGGLFGRIAEVQGGRSKVELITSRTFVVGVRLGSGERGVLRGQGPDKALVLEGIKVGVKVEKGDYIYTSGITDTAFPADLSVGRVREVADSSDGINQTIEVTPLADLSSVYVKVVLKDPPK